MSEEFNKGRHSCYSLHLHIVFVTKYRKKVFGDLHLQSLEATFKELCFGFDAELKEFNGEPDHVHLLISTSPKTPSVAKLVNSLKATSSRRIRREFNDVAGAFGKNCSLESFLLCWNMRWCAINGDPPIHRATG